MFDAGIRDISEFPPRGEQALLIRQTRSRKVAAANKKKLTELAKTANHQHNLSSKSWRDALEAAKLAGDALCEAKKLVKVRQWKTWVKSNFQGSARNDRVYRRVSRLWNHPEIKKARQAGTITSINTFLSAIKKPRPLSPTLEQEPFKTPEQLVHQNMRDVFAGGLRTLNKKQLQAFDENVHELWEACRTKLDELMLPPYQRQALEAYNENLIYSDPEDGPIKSDEEDAADDLRMKKMARRK